MSTPGRIEPNSVAYSRNGMDYVRLGNTGLIVSRICLGCMSYGTPEWKEWVLSEEQSIPFFQKALDLGINFFDTAEIYSDGISEIVTGNALKKLLSNSSFKREDIVIATKIHPARTQGVGGTVKHQHVQKSLSRKAIFDAVDASLKRLQVDYIDLYQIHRFDPNTSIEETMRALHDVVQSGKVRYIGASSMYAYQFIAMQQCAERNGWTKFSTMQNHYNLVYREEEREMIPYCISTGVGLIPWSPLARGYLTRPVDQNNTTRVNSDPFQKQMYYQKYDEKIVEHVHSIAKAKGTTAAKVAMAWITQKPGVSAPIVGATKMSHLIEAVESLQVKLTADEIKTLESDYQPHPILGHN